MEIQIKTEMLKSALEMISKEETRYYLTGVHFDFGARSYDMVATDGTVLFAYHSDEKENDLYPTAKVMDRFTVPGEIVKLALQATGKAATVKLKVWLDGNMIRQSLADIPFEPIDGTFPDWRRVFPTEITNTVQQFNLKLLAKFEKISRYLKQPVFITHNDGPCPVTFADENLTCLMMPMRNKSAPDLDHHIQLFSSNEFTATQSKKESA